MGCPVVHFEIGCRDRTKTSAFYSQLFGWQINEVGPAAMITTGADRGIQGHITTLGHEPYNYVNVYVEVDRLEAYLERAKSLGATVTIGPVPIPQGRFAWIKDPEGTLVGLLEPKR
ncbi:MAG TPA: VOC family protein [Polyangia bacterium]|nr:VOC family protein [Polyangia bacterium]